VCVQQSRKGGKKGPGEEQEEAKELLRAIDGEWRLIFTTGVRVCVVCT
jgi:hypothetical protein